MEIYLFHQSLLYVFLKKFIFISKPLPNPKNLRESEESEIISAKKPLPIPQKPPLTLFNQSSQSQLINKG